MASAFALDPAYRRVSVDEFLEMEFHGAKAELDDGLIFMMAGGSEKHAAIAANILVCLGTRLRGSGCRPYGSDLATRTGEQSIRFPDISIYCSPLSPEDRNKKLIGDPKVVFEVLSPSTSTLDQKTKLEEYRALAGVDAIVFIEPTTERIRLVARTGPEGWTDNWLVHGSDFHLACLNITIPHEEIFARD
jgi:Uma2 family endonuclease